MCHSIISSDLSDLRNYMLYKLLTLYLDFNNIYTHRLSAYWCSKLCVGNTTINKFLLIVNTLVYEKHHVRLWIKSIISNWCTYKMCILPYWYITITSFQTNNLFCQTVTDMIQNIQINIIQDLFCRFSNTLIMQNT